MQEKRKVPMIVTVTPVQRPARKLVLLRSQKADDYFSFCEEMGCEWHEILNSIPEKLDTAALLTLPQHLVREGESSTAAGVEVPIDYAQPLPQGYTCMELPPCTMLCFRGMPFADEADYGEAIGIVWGAIDSYRPELYGYRFDADVAPRFNFGASAETGAKIAVPARRVSSSFS